MTISIRFAGAARAVTGSRHVLTAGDRRVLLDCGMVQGPRRIADRANRELGVDAGALDAVVLSHAHIDHSGSLPRLVKLGFRGPIWCTEATASLASVMLADSAHIQAQDARHLGRRGRVWEPPYGIEDVDRTVRQLRGVRYRERFEACAGVEAELLDAGHILGSAMVVLDVAAGGQRRRIAFTGDHGRRNGPVLRDPERLPECDYLITESTYGDREHPAVEDVEAALAAIVVEEMHDGGRILVPAFSVGRTQNLVYHLGNLIEAGRIPAQPIFVDSPLSTRTTVILAGYPELFDARTRAILASGRHPFFFDGIRYVADVEESKSLNDVRQGIIISASGMCESGRILHHLERSIGSPADCVLIVGFQAQGTLGRKLADGWEEVRIFGDRHRVRCKVRGMDGLSAHADGPELLRSTRHLAAAARGVFVVHGEEKAALTHADRLADAGFRDVEVPVRGQEFVLAR